MQKIISYILGLVRFLCFSFKKTKTGVSITNIGGDFSAAHKFKSEFIRVLYTPGQMRDVARFCEHYNIEYYVQIGQSRNTDKDNALLIQKCDQEISIGKKPALYSVVNEDNDYTWERARNTKEYSKMDNVVKGAYTSCVESAGFSAIMKDLAAKRGDTTQIVHFYLKYNKGILNKFENFLRLNRFAYVVLRLKLSGVKRIIVGESHDGSREAEIIIPKIELRKLIKNDNGTFDGDIVITKYDNDTLKVKRYEGDYVFATKSGWNKIVNICNRLGVEAVLYYTAPFLNYPYNEMNK